jgi:hypothetical protein
MKKKTSFIDLNTKRRTKWVVWLRNGISREDDEWLVVWARDYNEAVKEATSKINFMRFCIRHVMPVSEFRKFYGRNFPL